jgi:hypothetical protein
MATRLPASERTREELRALIDGRLGSSDARSALLRLATRIARELRAGLVADYERELPTLWPASRTTSRPASPTCASRSPTAVRSRPRIFSSGCSSRSAGGSRSSPTRSARRPC